MALPRKARLCKMKKITKILTLSMIVLSTPVFAISIDGNTGLLSNGQVWIGRNSIIESSIGAGSYVSLDRGTSVTGSLYSNNAIYTGRDVSISGSASGNGVVSMDRNTSIGGNVYSGNTWMDGGTSVGGNVTAVPSGAPNANGNVSTGKGISVGGDMNAGGDIWVNKNSTIAGDASPGIGHTISTGSNVSIGGSTTPSNPTPDTVVVPSIPTPSGPMTPGTQGIWVGNNGSMTLAVGDYANVSTGVNVELALAAGTYNLASLWMGSGGLMTIDTTLGDVIINVLNNFGAGSNMEFAILGPGELFINVFEGDMGFGQDLTIDATLLVYEGSFYADDNANITGSIAAQNISIDQGSSFVYRGSGPTPDVPEPLTALAIASSLGGIGMYVRKRLKEEI